MEQLGQTSVWYVEVKILKLSRPTKKARITNCSQDAAISSSLRIQFIRRTPWIDEDSILKIQKTPPDR
jgi:hypothetical protein